MNILGHLRTGRGIERTTSSIHDQSKVAAAVGVVAMQRSGVPNDEFAFSNRNVLDSFVPRIVGREVVVVAGGVLRTSGRVGNSSDPRRKMASRTRGDGEAANGVVAIDEG